MLDTSSSLPLAADASLDDVLNYSRSLVEPRLRRVVDGLHPDVARICRHNLGWGMAANQRPDGTIRSTGKRVRAALAVCSAHAVGGGDDIAVAVGVAVELLHQASLLHDDIMDADEWRRGVQAAWAAFGTGRAVLAGDALLAEAVAAVAVTTAPAIPAALNHLLATFGAMITGQAEDLALERLPVRQVTLERYQRMADGKTGALFGCAASLGSRLLGLTQPTHALHEAGTTLGRAFQMADDMVGLWGDTARTGKAIGSDLTRGKRTLPMLLAASSGTLAGEELVTLLDAPDPDSLCPEKLLDLLEESGARDAAQEAIAVQTRCVAAVLDGADLPVAYRRQMSEFLTCATSPSITSTESDPR
ncbi:polyprenyl synthetase family protein [Streptomyces roseifaciens]|uniref:polyprenyl synthetase family protein n=1 Tax=Streptomyces roseifaciens TaxID=1488406 RepID=UPI0007C68797|nr:polyprenyl synthetase family protein [Streptomyces roseifaciens]